MVQEVPPREETPPKYTCAKMVKLFFVAMSGRVDKELCKPGYYCPLCYQEQMEGHSCHYWYFGSVPNMPPREEAEPRLRQRRHPRCGSGCTRGQCRFEP